MEREIREESRAYVNERFMVFSEEANVRDGSIWRALRVCKPKTENIGKIHSENYGIVFTPPEISEACADSLENQFTPNGIQSASVPTAICQKVDSFVLNNLPILTESEWVPLTSINELNIKNLVIKEAPGFDNISNQAIKLFHYITRLSLVNIFNGMIRLNYFPSLEECYCQTYP